MIIDAFIFGWELDLLECRLTELYDYVDVFLISESNQTFQGASKPLVLKDNFDRFDQWKDRIKIIEAVLPDTDNPWEREYAQRDAMNQALSFYPDEAYVLNGDVDEIPHPEILKTLKGDGVFSIGYKTYSMAVDWELPGLMCGTVISKNHHVQQFGMSELRRQSWTLPSVSGGWHLTWLGGEDMIKLKASSFSHTEPSVQDYVRNMGERMYTEGYHVLGNKLTPVEVDHTWPRWIYEKHCPNTWFRPRE
jgi:hypothetical protein